MFAAAETGRDVDAILFCLTTHLRPRSDHGVCFVILHILQNWFSSLGLSYTPL